MDSLRWSLLVWLMGSLLVVTAQGVILCECTTEECRDEGKDTCYAAHVCYSQYLRDTLTRGCIDDRSSLLCENQRPKGVDNWPSLYCCSDRNFCNKDVTPTLPTDPDEKKAKAPEARQPPVGGPDPRRDPPAVPRCPESGAGDDDTSAQRSNSSSSKVINPIYIAVPVAGVCVLLALIIFAMYLLRRRHHHHYDNYHHYHDHLAAAPPHGLKQPGAGMVGAGVGLGAGGGGGGGGGGVPLYHHHHHCDCICKKTLPPCGGKVNRCTDSERSSSGSETKLFLQA